MADDGVEKGPDGKARCWWCGDDDLYCAYHDREWGRPVTSDTRLFEKICLEGFQSGLSWLTILRKRGNFRAAFDDFDFHKVAQYTEKDVERLLGDAGIVRHRGKIEATINNAARAIALVDEAGSLAAYFWKYETPAEDRPAMLDRETLGQLGQTAMSQALSKDLKKRGWKFVGPTTSYAFMQAMGLVNDHLDTCSFRAEIEGERQALARPV